MSKKFLLSEEEKSRILNLHNNFDFKKLIQESKESQLLVEQAADDSGRYYSRAELEIVSHQGGGKKKVPIKTMFYGLEANNSISFFAGQIKYNKKFYNVWGDIHCDDRKNYIYLRQKEGSPFASGYFARPHEGFANQMRGIFCCGNKLKTLDQRKNAKVDFQWEKCGGGGQQEKCSAEELALCNIQMPGMTGIPSNQDNWYFDGTKCIAGPGTTQIGGFKSGERCNFCCSKNKPTPTPGSDCPKGVTPCSRYTDCSGVDIDNAPGAHLHMCNKCESVKKIQGCLGVKQDGAWGCKTESALQSKYPGMSGKAGLKKEDIDKICTKVAD